MSHDQVRDAIFVTGRILDARRRAQACALRQERNKLVCSMVNQADRISKIDSLLQLLE